MEAWCELEPWRYQTTAMHLSMLRCQPLGPVCTGMPQAIPQCQAPPLLCFPDSSHHLVTVVLSLDIVIPRAVGQAWHRQQLQWIPIPSRVCGTRTWMGSQ